MNGRPRPDDRKVINGKFVVLRTGTPWRDLPERYGPYTTVCNRLNCWAKAGVRLRIVGGAGGEVAALTATDRLIDHPRPPACGGW